MIGIAYHEDYNKYDLGMINPSVGSKQKHLKSAILIGAELRDIMQIFETAILFQKKEPDYNSVVLYPCRQ